MFYFALCFVFVLPVFSPAICPLILPDAHHVAGGTFATSSPEQLGNFVWPLTLDTVNHLVAVVVLDDSV